MDAIIDLFDDKDENTHQQFKAFMDFKKNVENYIDEVIILEIFQALIIFRNLER